MASKIVSAPRTWLVSPSCLEDLFMEMTVLLLRSGTLSSSPMRSSSEVETFLMASCRASGVVYAIYTLFCVKGLKGKTGLAFFLIF